MTAHALAGNVPRGVLGPAIMVPRQPPVRSLHVRAVDARLTYLCILFFPIGRWALFLAVRRGDDRSGPITVRPLSRPTREDQDDQDRQWSTPSPPDGSPLNTTCEIRVPWHHQVMAAEAREDPVTEVAPNLEVRRISDHLGDRPGLRTPRGARAMIVAASGGGARAWCCTSAA